MADTPEPVAVAKIRGLCGELAARHGLDDQTCDELCGHLEDKLLAYLDGSCRVSEDDALLLVRAHFGEADAIAQKLGGGPVAGGVVKRQLHSAALATAVVSLVLFPACALVIMCAVSGVVRGIVATAIGVAFLAFVELGLYLAARADPRSPWQRLVAALALIAPLFVFWRFLAYGVSLYPSLSIGKPFFNFYIAIAATAFVSFVCHLWLLALLLRPVRIRRDLTPASTVR